VDIKYINCTENSFEKIFQGYARVRKNYDG